MNLGCAVSAALLAVALTAASASAVGSGPSAEMIGLRVVPSRFSATAHGESLARNGPARITWRWAANPTYTGRFDLPVRVTLTVSRCVGRFSTGLCTSRTPVRGPFFHVDRHAGRVTLRFTGRLCGRRLRPGLYLLHAAPSAGGVRWAGEFARFRITASPVG